jgi:hypothetical protein
MDVNYHKPDDSQAVRNIPGTHRTERKLGVPNKRSGCADEKKTLGSTGRKTLSIQSLTYHQKLRGRVFLLSISLISFLIFVWDLVTPGNKK